MPITHRSRGESPTPDEKISINVSVVDLGHVDLLVAEGFYANRTDLVRTALRNQLARHADAVQQLSTRRSLMLGIRQVTADELRAAKAAGQPLHLRVLGLATIAADVTPQLALAGIASVEVLGALHASAAVKKALAPRIR